MAGADLLQANDLSGIIALRAAWFSALRLEKAG